MKRILTLCFWLAMSSGLWLSTASASVAPVSVSPAAGNALSQSFTFTFQDSNGYSDLSVVDVLINNYLDGTGACYFAFVPATASSGYVYLVDNAGDGLYVSGTPMLVPSGTSVQNSQCTINAAASSVSASGTTLTLNVDIIFSTGFAGNRIFYTAARSNTQNSGWQALGTWHVPGSAPSGPAVGGMSPARSTGGGQTYSFTFTDTSGYSDLGVLDILTNSSLDGVNACYIAFVPTSAGSGYLYLVNDAGGGGYANGSPLTLPSSGTLQNSQCTISAAGSSVSASGNSMTLNLAITFSAGFAGNQVFYLAARNNGAGNSGWQPAGSVTVSGASGGGGSSPPPSGGGSYSTTFPATENPISQGGNWLNGLLNGLNWANVQTTPGFAFGTESGFINYNDSTAVLTGTWGANQTVQATIHVTNPSSAFEEVELRLRTTITPLSITGYEINFSCSANPSNYYAQIVRWNGLLGSFTQLDGASYHCVNGDVVKATIVGNTITAYVNGSQIMQVTDGTFSSGSPGMGFYLQGSGSTNTYGFSSFSASSN